MWSDELNKKIQEAEAKSDSSSTGTAWEKMELLLDKHLPQNRKRRGFIYLLIPIMLGAGTALYFILQTANKNNNVIGQKNIEVRAPTQANKQLPGKLDKEVVSADGQTTAEKPAITDKSAQPDPEVSFTDKQNDIQPTQKTGSESSRQLKSKNVYADQNSLKTQTAGKTKKDAVPNEISAKTTPATADPSKIDNPGVNNTIIPKADSVGNPASQNPLVVDNKKEDTVQPATKTKIVSQKRKSSFSNNFSLNFSFGPDISGVNFEDPGQVQLQYGIGAGYAISKKFSVRTGFYAGSKKYSADSADYHSSYAIHKLQKIDADCFVYEIPVTLAFNFNSVKKHNWFVAGGLSSYLMKEETYDYYYSDSWGQTQHYSHTYKNENTHLFSIINLSGGYRYQFTDRLSFIAEPYVKIPLDGIGAGKVKLTNTGVLFTVDYKPFLKK